MLWNSDLTHPQFLKVKKMGKTYYILQKEAYSIYPQVDCLSVFQAQQISSWKIFRPVRLKSDERRNIISHSALLV